jgi:hypothetical protein
MKKSTIMYLTIISTILSIIFILFTYYGIDRYFEMYIRDTNYFIEKYSQLPKAKDGRVVITVTTTPDKIGKMSPMINSVLDQTVKADLIALVMPAGTKYEVPAYINKVAVVFEAGKDYGQGTNLVPILLREKECDTTIIALKDNIVYGKDFVEFLMEESVKKPDSVITDKKNTAILVKPEHFGCDVINRDIDKFTDDWFIQKAKNKTVVQYSENYRLL